MDMLIPHNPSTLDEFLALGPYVSYVYSYPHKTAYRSLAPPLNLHQLWRDEDRQSLFLYLHIPFCEMRCGFCNLFTYSQPAEQVVDQYLGALERQARLVHHAADRPCFSRVAIGGGTPSFLSERQLQQLFAMLREQLGVALHRVPASFEVSPATIDPAKLQCLHAAGVDRISMGIQSFVKSDLNAIGRPQQPDLVDRAVELTKAVGFPTLNLDLIYGGQAQTVETFMRSLAQVLRYAPEEIYLYPLYVRPLTGLARHAAREQDCRLDCYRSARQELLSRGYQQLSMRNFRRTTARRNGAPLYRCQEDGMIGLGCGAHSYTRQLHYADPFAVTQQAVLARIQQYIAQDNAQLTHATHGIALDEDEQQRRYLIVSLLLAEGVDRQRFAGRFGQDVCTRFPQLRELEQRGLLAVTSDRLRLTPAGLELSDAIGPWLYSRRVRERMEAFAWTDA